MARNSISTAIRTLQGLLLAPLLICGCGVQQRAAEKLIDPRLRSEGVLVERQGGGKQLVLGAHYRVEGLVLTDEGFDGQGPLAADAGGRSRPTQQLRLEFELIADDVVWTVQCVGQRRQPPDHDLAAAADELRDEVAAQCQLAGGDQRWVLRIDGSLAANLRGSLEPVGAADRPAKAIEIIMWYRLWNVSRRHLPASLAVVHGEHERTEAALILDSPERAWLGPELDGDTRALDLASLLALRLLPLGFDG